MRTSIKMLAAVLLGALSAPGAALAENWYPFYMVPKGVAYVDKDSVILRSGEFTAKTESTFPDPQQIQRNGKVFVYIKTKDTVIVDCKASVFRYQERDLYDQSGALQLILTDSNDPVRIIPASPEEVLAKAYCPMATRR